jgi:hypothetical protein
MRRHPDSASKDPDEMKRTEPGHRGQVVDRDVLLEAGFYIRLGASDRYRLLSNRAQDRPGTGVTRDQSRQHLEKPSFDFQQRRVPLFKPDVQGTNLGSQFKIVDYTFVEERNRFLSSGDLASGVSQQGRIEVEHAVSPSVLGRGVASMNLIGIDQVDRAAWGDDIRAAIVEAQGPRLNHTQAETLMSMTRKILCDVARAEQLCVAKLRQTPQSDLFFQHGRFHNRNSHVFGPRRPVPPVSDPFASHDTCNTSTTQVGQMLEEKTPKAKKRLGCLASALQDYDMVGGSLKTQRSEVLGMAGEVTGGQQELSADEDHPQALRA